MKQFITLILCCVACSVFAQNNQLELGKALLNQHEYQQAREVFDLIISHSDPSVTSLLEKTEYLSAALYAMIASLQMDDLTRAQRYNNLLQTQIFASSGIRFECTNCGRIYIEPPSICSCGSTSFTFEWDPLIGSLSNAK